MSTTARRPSEIHRRRALWYRVWRNACAILAVWNMVDVGVYLRRGDDGWALYAFAMSILMIFFWAYYRREARREAARADLEAVNEREQEARP